MAFVDSIEINFIWQHYFHGRWVLYSDKDLKLLNKAIKKNQKTLQLPSSNPKQQIVVNFDHLLQKNKISSVKQKMRPVIYGSEFVSWMWADRDDNLNSYKPKIVFLLEVAYQRGEIMFKYYDQDDYKIDLLKFQEINENTNAVRTVFREVVQIPNISTEIFNISLDNRVFRKMCSDKSLSFQTRCIVNLSTLSSLSSRMSSSPHEIILPKKSFSLSEEDDIAEKKFDLSLAVDTQCPNKNEFHIYCDEKTAFSATLSLVNLQMNQNKFCIIQLLQQNETCDYILLQRCGRVGTKGRCAVTKHGNNVLSAISEFEEKFYKKTKNRWIDRSNFTFVPGLYNFLKIDMDTKPKELAAACYLHPAIQSLLELICDKRTMDSIMREMYYDSDCVPLGQLTLKQIKQGYSALSKIAEIISHDGSGSALVLACDEFYSSIPHNFGQRCLPIIQTKREIEEKLNMLEALFNIRIAMKALNFHSSVLEKLEHPLSRFYGKLHCTLDPLDPDSVEYNAILLYLKSTHGPTHSTYDIEIIDAFSCNPVNEHHALSSKDTTFLLWHGSRITNWAGILKDGLRISPPEAPTSGDMFGKGLYFADTSTKSANYCFPTRKQNQGLLLLCEVCMGSMLHLIDCNPRLPQALPRGYDGVFGIGRITPSNFSHGVLSFNAKVPIGPLQEDPSLDTALNYNEYVVYDVNRAKMKYLLRIQFNFK